MAREKDEEDEFRRQTMERFAEQDRLEQMNAQKRRIKVAQHAREVERLIQEKRAMFEAAMVSNLKLVQALVFFCQVFYKALRHLLKCCVHANIILDPFHPSITDVMHSNKCIRMVFMSPSKLHGTVALLLVGFDHLGGPAALLET